MRSLHTLWCVCGVCHAHVCGQCVQCVLTLSVVCVLCWCACGVRVMHVCDACAMCACVCGQSLAHSYV